MSKDWFYKKQRERILKDFEGDKILSKNDFLDLLIDLQEDSKIIRGKLNRSERKAYNTYVRSFGRDLTNMLLKIEFLLKFLIIRELQRD